MMDRREFLRTAGLISTALTSSTTAGGAVPDQQEYGGAVGSKGKVSLSNSYLSWQLDWSEGRLRSSLLENKLTGKTFPLSDVREIELTLDSSDARIEIPWWKFVFGPDRTSTLPHQEQGLRDGYHLPSFSDEAWGATENLLLRSLQGGGLAPDQITYHGYGWFRHEFELPKDGHRQKILFVLGGYDFQDWNEYWIYVNGRQAGHRVSSGRWRIPGEFAIRPEDPNYSSLRFGPGEKNLLAIRTRGYDKRFGGLSDEVLRHYVFEPFLVDQFISVGKPYFRVSDFEVERVEQAGSARALCKLRSSSQGVHVTAHYELDGATRRKWLDIKNQSSKELLLLDVCLDDFAVPTFTSEGGPGEPVLIGGEAFCAIEHPAGVNQGEHGRVRTMHFPARHLAPGASTSSHVSLVSVAKAGEALNHFVAYIQERSPRKKSVVSIYDPFGINNQWGGCPTQCDVEMLNGLEVLRKWREQGFQFDYYVPDWGWVDQASDLTRFAPQCFPNGPGKVVERVNELGMKFGLWFSVSGGNQSCGEYAPAWASAVPGPGEPSKASPSPLVYRNGYPIDTGAPVTFCLASEPYFSILRDALLHHIHENSLKFFKLDSGSYYCNSTHHEHLPGKYSVEAMYERLLQIADIARKACPGIYVMWYWGLRSPFFALYGDSIFESGLFMEGSGTSWFPSLYYRDSVTLNLDQGTQFAKTIPPVNKDSLGVWLADNRWGNFMGNERWREALVMDLGRGNLLFPQLWGDVYLLDAADVRFLAEITSLARENESLLLKRRLTLGDPWKNEVYGYGYSDGLRGMLFLNNVHFAARKMELDLGPALGLEGASGTPVKIISHFPERRQLARENGSGFQLGERIEIWLRPFEVLMLEIGLHPEITEGLPVRGTSGQEVERLGISLPLEPMPAADWMALRFADAARFEATGKAKRTLAFETVLPSLEGDDQPILAIAVRLRQGTQEWRYAPVVVEIVQIVARIGDHKVRLIPIPEARQYGDTQKAGCSWVVYKSRLSSQWSHQKLQFAVHAYLPHDVEASVEAWMVRQWWQISTRPLPDGFYGDEPS